jgi:hypothetical protein
MEVRMLPAKAVHYAMRKEKRRRAKKEGKKGAIRGRHHCSPTILPTTDVYNNNSTPLTNNTN